MSIDNPAWGAPRIHGELLKLGFEVAQLKMAKYIIKRWGPPSPGWRTFLQNHAPDIAAMDLFGVPTINFSLLYCFVMVADDVLVNGTGSIYKTSPAGCLAAGLIRPTATAPGRGQLVW